MIPPDQQLLPSLGLTPGGHRLPAVTPLPPPARPWAPAGEGLSRTKLREDFVANKGCIEQPVLESLPSVVRARAGGTAAGQRQEGSWWEESQELGKEGRRCASQTMKTMGKILFFNLILPCRELGHPSKQ